MSAVLSAQSFVRAVCTEVVWARPGITYEDDCQLDGIEDCLYCGYNIVTKWRDVPAPIFFWSPVMTYPRDWHIEIPPEHHRGCVYLLCKQIAASLPVAESRSGPQEAK